MLKAGNGSNEQEAYGRLLEKARKEKWMSGVSFPINTLFQFSHRNRSSLSSPDYLVSQVVIGRKDGSEIQWPKEKGQKYKQWTTVRNF